MNETQRRKLERQLSSTEVELRQQLDELLPQAAAGASTVFVNADFNPHGLRPALWHGAGLLAASKACLELRQSLDLSTEGSPAALYLAACQEAADLANEHRRGPKRLAEWMVKQLADLR